MPTPGLTLERHYLRKWLTLSRCLLPSAVLKEVMVRYNTFGQLNKNRDNVLVVCHALTGNARLDSWWSSILGPNKPFDTDRYDLTTRISTH